LNLYPHGDALAIEAELGQDGNRPFVNGMLIVVYLDQPKRIVVSINTGWNDLAQGQLSLKTIPNDVNFLADETICHLASDDLGTLNEYFLLI
jgi:hypothetical protein